MLDAKELAKRIRAAMDYREPPLPSTDLADKCGVTKQAVYEWRATGRIGKGHLPVVADATGMPLIYFLEPERGSLPETRTIWRRLGKMFAKAATVLLLAIPSAPTEVQAHSAFDIIRIHIAWRRFLLGFAKC